MEKNQEDVRLKVVSSSNITTGCLNVMFRRLSLPLAGGMTPREFAHFKKFGRDLLR